MTEVFEISVYLTASLIFFAVSYLAFSYYLSNRRMANGILKMSAQIEALQRKLEQLQKESESRKVENTDAFVRFVSQSRDKAFEYIEDVQESIQKLKGFADKVGTIENNNASAENLAELQIIIDNVLSHLPDNES